ncbi:MAG TPA: hypothetical protein VGU01_03020 [Sphingomicrobium sp.]|nr:hypothetical protein [Sphingomicrobium sp.]
MLKAPLTKGPWKQHHLYPTALVSEADPFLSLLTVDRDGSALFLSEDDCRLAAAAPDLLGALRDLIGWVPGPAHWHTDACPKAVERAVAAIAKATGAA